MLSNHSDGATHLTAGLLMAALLLLAAATLEPRTAAADQRSGFDASRATFSLRVNKELLPYRVSALFVLPGEELTFTAEPRREQPAYQVLLPSGEELTSHGGWTWTAPRGPGLQTIRVRDTLADSLITLNVFVMVPYDELTGESINGYRIGSYPAIAYKGLDIYRPPRGFVEVTEENRNTLVSPHFTLGQFLCKQEGSWPRYLVLRERLLLKLELLLEKVNEAGHACDTFTVMSGYRTPHYNHLIGNVRYSRHVWGGAADIFIDVDPADGIMDDLNGDGRLDVRDAHVLYEIADRMYGNTWYVPFVGGLGAYRKTSNHGPFVHVDARGFHARWGD